MNSLDHLTRVELQVEAFTDHALGDQFQNTSPYASFKSEMKFYSQGNYMYEILRTLLDQLESIN